RQGARGPPLAARLPRPLRLPVPARRRQLLAARPRAVLQRLRGARRRPAPRLHAADRRLRRIRVAGARRAGPHPADAPPSPPPPPAPLPAPAAPPPPPPGPLVSPALSVFLSLPADDTYCPLAPEPFFSGFAVPDVVQHRAFTLLIVAFAVFEWRVATGRA